MLQLESELRTRKACVAIIEVSETKERLIDVFKATRAAVEEGIVAGGGKALLHWPSSASSDIWRNLLCDLFPL
jgi:hypothetical protein